MEQKDNEKDNRNKLENGSKEQRNGRNKEITEEKERNSNHDVHKLQEGKTENVVDKASHESNEKTNRKEARRQARKEKEEERDDIHFENEGKTETETDKGKEKRYLRASKDESRELTEGETTEDEEFYDAIDDSKWERLELGARTPQQMLAWKHFFRTGVAEDGVTTPTTFNDIKGALFLLFFPTEKRDERFSLGKAKRALGTVLLYSGRSSF